MYRVETVQGDCDPEFNIIRADHGCIRACVYGRLFAQNEDDSLQFMKF